MFPCITLYYSKYFNKSFQTDKNRNMEILSTSSYWLSLVQLMQVLRMKLLLDNS